MLSVHIGRPYDQPFVALHDLGFIAQPAHYLNQGGSFAQLPPNRKGVPQAIGTAVCSLNARLFDHRLSRTVLGILAPWFACSCLRQKVLVRNSHFGAHWQPMLEEFAGPWRDWRLARGELPLSGSVTSMADPVPARPETLGQRAASNALRPASDQRPVAMRPLCDCEHPAMSSMPDCRAALWKSQDAGALPTQK